MSIDRYDLPILLAILVVFVGLLYNFLPRILNFAKKKEKKELQQAIIVSGGKLQHFFSKINPNQEQNQISIIKRIDYQYNYMYNGENPSNSLVITDSHGSMYFIQWGYHSVLLDSYPLSYQMIHFNEIKGIELFVDNQRVYGNKIAAAVAGGLFLGIVGLVSGVLISQNKMKQKYTIYLSTNNLTYPSIHIDCKNRNTALEILGTLEILENRQ